MRSNSNQWEYGIIGISFWLPLIIVWITAFKGYASILHIRPFLLHNDTANSYFVASLNKCRLSSYRRFYKITSKLLNYNHYWFIFIIMDQWKFAATELSILLFAISMLPFLIALFLFVLAFVNNKFTGIAALELSLALFIFTFIFAFLPFSTYFISDLDY